MEAIKQNKNLFTMNKPIKMKNKIKITMINFLTNKNNKNLNWE